MVIVDAQHAALLNGIAGHVHDYDDTHLNTIIHPSGSVASALIAVAEWKAHAIDIAATQVTGLREMIGTHTKAFHSGRVAQNGLVAAILASNDYTGFGAALEASHGWAKVVSNAKSNVDENFAAWLGTESPKLNG
ncbi:hypothetical protein MMC11_006977 [Xylographa trunciseda]|nr:hypothetical protein [Xylographa trunciseda]